METDLKDAVQAYWEDPSTKSLIDKNLHELEMQTVCRYLLDSDHLLDFGCGDATATIRYAGKAKTCLGIDRSERLLDEAAKNIKAAKVTNITLKKGDILDVDSISERFDMVVTQRMLINLTSWEDQQKALYNIRRLLKPAGRYIMIENANDSFEAINDMRSAVGIGPIPQHWHNRFFDYDKLMEFAKGKFELLNFHDFGLYYLLTRLYVPMFANFTGFGANAVKDPIFEVSDEKARILFEMFADRIQIKGCRALGPIQAFIFRRTDDAD